MNRAERLASSAFLVAAAAAVALLVRYVQAPDTQWEGALLGVAMLAFGGAFVLIGNFLLPPGPAIDQRERSGADLAEEEEVEEAFERIDVLTRRRFLLGTAGTAVAAFVGVALWPLRSLGPAPGNALARTPWRRGLRLVNEAGRPVRAGEIPLGGLATVFPEGAVGSADGQAVLVRVEPELLRLPEGREAWAPEGLLAYSKVCTHAGCPVGLYEAQSHELLCPCHQSAFNVLDGAHPTSGPAARAQPQLPLEIASDGTLIALGDFSDPIGPGYWDRPEESA
jgi:ubiquinol-cytochrome c reductase iron-sulfur subunit